MLTVDLFIIGFLLLGMVVLWIFYDQNKKNELAKERLSQGYWIDDPENFFRYLSWVKLKDWGFIEKDLDRQLDQLIQEVLEKKKTAEYLVELMLSKASILETERYLYLVYQFKARLLNSEPENVVQLMDMMFEACRAEKISKGDQSIVLEFIFEAKAHDEMRPKLVQTLEATIRSIKKQLASSRRDGFLDDLQLLYAELSHYKY